MKPPERAAWGQEVRQGLPGAGAQGADGEGRPVGASSLPGVKKML